jgi:hypothetical protein
LTRYTTKVAHKLVRGDRVVLAASIEIAEAAASRGQPFRTWAVRRVDREDEEHGIIGVRMTTITAGMDPIQATEDVTACYDAACTFIVERRERPAGARPTVCWEPVPEGGVSRCGLPIGHDGEHRSRAHDMDDPRFREWARKEGA